MSNKYAYLIIAHHNFELLQFLIEDLDHELNDIYIHIDIKTKNVPFDVLTKNIKYSNIYYIPRISVNWGGYSQIQCALNLLAEAVSKDQYEYYHLITGETFPLKSQDYIHEFFNRYRGKLFIGFDKNDFSDRVKYIYLFNEMGKPSIKNAVFCIIQKSYLKMQKFLNINFIPDKKLIFKKGFAYWSITHELAGYILKHQDSLQKIYQRSFCCDEVFLQTLVYNSPFYDKVYDKENEYRACMCFTKWELSGNTPDLSFHKNEINELLQSDKLFARKFSDDDCLSIVKTIKEKRIELFRS